MPSNPSVSGCVFPCVFSPGAVPAVLSGGFSPATIADLDLWLDPAVGLYDATSGGSAATDGNGVLRWEDLSGNGAHLTEATNPPTLDADGGPGATRPAVLFNGTNQKLGRNSATFDQPCSIFMVLRMDTFTANEYVLDTRGAGVRPLMISVVSGQAPRGRGSTPTTGTPSLPVGTWGVVSMIDTATSISVQVNDGTPSTQASSLTTAGATNLSLGCNNLAAPSTFADCSIAGLLAYGRALTTDEQAQVVAYLMTLNGIT